MLNKFNKNQFLFLCIIISTLWSSCGNGTKTPSAEELYVVDEDIEENLEENIFNPGDEAMSMGEQLMTGVEYEGKIVDKSLFENGLGKYYIILTTYQSKKGEEIDTESDEWQTSKLGNKYPDYAAISLKSYALDSTQYQQLYEWKDTATLPQSTITYCNGTFEVLDLDNDGKSEVLYIYEIESAATPTPIVLVVGNQKRKATISGILPSNLEDFKKTIPQKQDVAFSKLPTKIKAYANKKWAKKMAAQQKKLETEAALEQ